MPLFGKDEDFELNFPSYEKKFSPLRKNQLCSAKSWRWENLIQVSKNLDKIFEAIAETMKRKMFKKEKENQLSQECAAFNPESSHTS